jgi:hypothetical protein
VQGSVEAFTAEVRAAIADRLRPLLACIEPECRLEVLATAGSVNLAVFVVLPFGIEGPSSSSGGPNALPLHTTVLPSLLVMPGTLLSAWRHTALHSHSHRARVYYAILCVRTAATRPAPEAAYESTFAAPASTTAAAAAVRTSAQHRFAASAEPQRDQPRATDWPRAPRCHPCRLPLGLVHAVRDAPHGQR